MLKAKILTLAALFVVLISNVYVVFAEQEILPLLWKYEEDGLTYERVCKPGKLVIMSNSKNTPVPNVVFWYIIDLSNGNLIYKTDPYIENDIYVNYNGDKFYVFNYLEKKWKEYDVKTKEFIRYTFGADQNKNNSAHYVSSDSAYVEFDYFTHSLLFKNLNTGFLLDSFKIPNTPNQPYYTQGTDGFKFSNDGRFYSFTLQSNSKPYTKRFYLYDRVNREIIFEKKVEPYYGNFRYSFFNNSNKMSYAEEVQLPGDDTVYSYIRIFDPDLRSVTKDYKIDKSKIEIFILNQNDRNIIYQAGSNWKHIFDLIKEEKLNYTFGFYGSKPILAVDSMIYSTHAGNEFLFASKIDGTVGIDDKIIDVGTILYPNPTNNQISLTIPAIYYWGTWQINDLTGTVVLKGKLDNQNDLTIDISNLIPQIYYLTLVNGKEKITYKIIKQ